MARRTLVGSLAAAAALKAEPPQSENSGQPSPRPRREGHTEWRPKLGVLGPYTPANVAFAKQAGFKNMILRAGRQGALNPDTVTDAQIASIKDDLNRQGIQVSAFQVDGDHIHPDPTRRAALNAEFVKIIDLAGKLGVHYIGTQSGQDASKS